jgi:thioesterase domain-containing protein
MNDKARSDLQAKINRRIPLSEAMGYRITELDASHIVVSAPLAPNINIHGTGFAGSLYALGILTAWGLCAHLIANAGIDADLVVVQASIRYRVPVRGDILCRCEILDDDAAAFVGALADTGRSRIVLEVAIGDGPAAKIEATMHANIA